VRRRHVRSLIRTALRDLFDQRTGFGRLALVHVAMMGADTMVTVSLAGSLFFSVSPDEAKTKVLAYLLLTFAPFAVVSPVLGPLIDRSSSGRRVLVALSAGARVVLCWLMASRLTSVWLFPLAFSLLVAQKLYAVTRGTLVPEMARSNQFDDDLILVDGAGWPSSGAKEDGFAGFNAQLTLLGAITGLAAGGIAAGILKSAGARYVLISAAALYMVATVASIRLPRPVRSQHDVPRGLSAEERDRHLLNPYGDSEVTWGLSATAVGRFANGFATFMLAFGLRRLHAGLGWFAAGLSASGIGALVGLAFVTRVRSRMKETSLLFLALTMNGVGAFVCSLSGALETQIVLVAWLGLCGAVMQPSFDAITQRHIPLGAQGRTFARLAVRQQLAWVIGALVPVAVSLQFKFGDELLALILIAAALTYGLGRRRHR
jgi:MFS family permease